jgi:hypothetical protein
MLHHPENFRGNVFGLLPMTVIPFLESGNLGTGNLNVQLDVFADSRVGEI